MSEKKVNVKITASISEFEKAIKKAQKEVKELTDVLEDINKNKFGENLEKQFKDISDAAEKMRDQLEDMKDTLDDIEKIKLDKVEKEFEDIADATEDLNDKLEDTVDKLDKLNKAKADKLKDDLEDTSEAAEDLNETLEDTKESVEDLAKTKLDKLEQQYKDVLDTADKLNETIEDNQEALSELDRTDVDKLRNSLENIAESSEDIGDRLGDLRKQLDNLDSEDLNSLEGEFKQVGSAIEDLGDKVRDTASDVDKHLNDVLKDTDERVENLTESVEDLDDKFSDIDGLEDIKGDFKKLFDDKDIKVNLEGDKSGFFDNLADGFISGSIAGDKLSDAVQDIVDGVDRLADSMKDMNQFTFEEQIKNYDEFINDMVKAQDEYNETLEKRNKLEEELADKRKKIDDDFDKYEEEVDKAYAELEALEKKEEAINHLKEATEEYKKELDYWSEASKVATKELEDQEKVIQDLQKEYDDTIDAVNDFTDRYKNLFKVADGTELELLDINNLKQTKDIIDSLIDTLEKSSGTIERSKSLGFDLDNEKIKKAVKEYKDFIGALAAGEISLGFDESVEEVNRLMDNISKAISEGFGTPEEHASKLKKLISLYVALQSDVEVLNDLYKEQEELIDRLAKAEEGLNKKDTEQSKLDELKEKSEIIEKNIERLNEEAKELEDYRKANDIAGESEEELQKEIEETTKKLQQKSKELKEAEKALHNQRVEANKSAKEAQQLEADLDALNKTLEKGNKTAKEQADAFNQEYKAYEKLSKKVKEYLEDESKSILLREKVAKSFKQVSDAMEKVYSDSSKLNNADLITKTLADAADYIRELDLVSTDNLQKDLERLGEIIDDKTEKIKRFKELNKEFGSDDGKTAHWLEQEAKAIKEFTDKVGFAVEAADTLRKAWGDVSIGGEDHLKIRARSEALSDYGKTLQENIRYIRQYYYELETLDEIYEQATDEQRQTIDDYRAWEKSREELIKYNDAIQDYIVILKDAGGQIDEKFLTDGKFDVDKFIADFDKMGTSTMVLSKQINAIKSALLENLKVQKEAAQNAVKNAEANLENAKASLEAAESEKELADAKERVTKAEKELADAKEKSKHVDRERIEDAKKLIEAFNEQAEALRKLGIAVEDINKADISKFDKSLGSLLDSLDAFGDDKPKGLGDLKEDIAALFESFDSFDIGDIGDGLKNIFSGIPGEAKLAIAAIGGVTAALNKLYETGKQDFFEGLSKAGEVLGKIGDIAKDIGSEVKDAFEDITGSNLDWSSLMTLGVEFEHQMQLVGSLAGANVKQVEELTAKAKELGGSTQFSATQVAQAFEYMATAGWDTEDMLNGINGVINLSIGSCSDLAKTASIVTDGITALGMESSDTAEFVNKLAAVANASNTSVELFGGTLKQVGSLAGSLGVTMTDLSTATGLMANAGVKGTRAGTALKNVLSNMASPTDKQADALEELGFVASETGSYLKMTAAGNVDLEATIKQLMTSTEGLDKAQRAALLTTIAGKEALPGLMAVISQGEEAWNDLSETIDNSSSSIQYWNENMQIVGKSGEDAKKHIENLKQVYEETIETARAMDISQSELSHVIALLGHDSEVTAGNVTDLLNVQEQMNQASEDQIQSLRELDKGTTQLVNKNFDYNKTIAAIRADTQGLTQEQKKNLEALLKNVESYDEAKEIIADYQDEINKANGTSIDLTETLKRQTFAELDLVEKLEYLRNTMGETIDAEEEAILKNIGLGNSIDEIREILAMSSTEWEKYKENLEKVDGLVDQISGELGETFKSSLLEIASQIEDVVLAIYDKMLPGLQVGADAIKDFFNAWRGDGAEANYNWDNFEKALDDLTKKIQEGEPKIKAAIKGLFDNIDTFINGGSFQSILDIGTSVITGICDGILQAQEDGTLQSAVDGAIKKISQWIIDNAPKIEEAGLAILEALVKGIEDNEDLIGKALDALCEVIGSWTETSGTLKAQIGKFSDSFADLAVKNMTSSIKAKASELWSAFFGSWDGASDGDLTQDDMDGLFSTFSPSKLLGDGVGWIGKKLGEGAKGIWNWFTGESYAAEIEEPGTTSKPTTNKTKANTKTKTTKTEEVDIKTLVNMKSDELNQVKTELQSLQTVAQTTVNSIRTSFTGISNIIRNQMVNCANIVRNQAVNMSNIFRNQFVNMANIVRNQFLNISNIVRNQALTWANIVRNQCLNMANIFRNQFLSMSNVARNQMLNVSNIIRNQAINWANIIRNQVLNARNAFTQQMISMASVARTQMVNVSNIIRNQSLSWANIVSNQAKRARDNFTRQMMSMVKVARNQMYNVLTTVRGYMSQISSATNKTINLRVNKSVNNVGGGGGTGNLPVTVASASLYAANMASTATLGSNNISALSARASSVSGYNSSSPGTRGAEESQIIHTHVYLEGKEIARATAKHIKGEIKTLNKREDRKRGVK